MEHLGIWAFWSRNCKNYSWVVSYFTSSVLKCILKLLASEKGSLNSLLLLMYTSQFRKVCAVLILRGCNCHVK